jgi:hypothetical protein
MKKTLFILLFGIFFLSSCHDGKKYDGLILVDTTTNKKYVLKHNAGDTYFIDEVVIQIDGKDTTYVLK